MIVENKHKLKALDCVNQLRAEGFPRLTLLEAETRYGAAFQALCKLYC
jgi:hypothetical protein